MERGNVSIHFVIDNQQNRMADETSGRQKNRAW
jgi:hypothetical protein